MAERMFTPFVRQCLVTTAVCCSVVGQGCLIGYPGVLLPQLQRPGSAISVFDQQASWLAAAHTIPMFFGHFLISPVMERWGRKTALIAVILVMILSWMIMALATGFQGLLFAKILQGLAYCLIMPLRSVVIGEYTSPRHRGGFLSLVCISKTFGILFVHFIGSITDYKTTALVSLVFPITGLVMTMYSPESPSWFAKRGKHEECRKAFIWLRGMEEITELEALINASKNMKDHTEENKVKEIGAIMKKKEFYKPIFLMFALFITMDFSGSLVMSTYAVLVLKLLMGPDVQAHLWMVALDGQRLFFSIVAIYVINRFRRRTLLLSTGSLCVGSMLAMAVYVFLRTKGLVESQWIPGILINLQIFSLGIGLMPLPIVIAGEIFPLQHRGLGSSISVIAHASSIFVILKTFPSLIAVAGFCGAYVLLAGVMAASLATAWALLPETRGRTLQQIEEHFRGAFSDAENQKETEPLKGPI